MSAPGARSVALLAGSLAALVAATFGGAAPASRVFFQRDVHTWWEAHAAVLRRVVAERALPLWNPWEGFGAPLLADASFQLAYPPAWLALVLSPPAHFKVLVAFHALLAGLGAAALARRLGLGRTGAGVAGAAYALSGPFLSGASLWHHYAGAAWLPWLLWALEGLVRRPGLATSLTLGLVGAAQVVAGSGDLCLAGGLLGGARLALHLLRARPARARLRALAWAGALAAALALALGAVQWMPTAASARQGHRAALDARTNTYWSLHPASLADLAVPRLVSDLPLSEEARQALFEGREPLLGCLYAGVVPLALAALGLAMRAPLALPAAAGLLFFVVASLGRHTPVYSLLLGLPGFSLMRYPQKFLWPAALCLALLAAAGGHAWAAGWGDAARRRARRVALVLLLAVALLLAAAWWVSGPGALSPWLDTAEPGRDAAPRTASLKLARSGLLAAVVALLLWRRAGRDHARRATTLALLLLGAGDLVAVGRGTNPLAPRALLDHRPAVLARLAGEEVRVHAAVEGRACLAAGSSPLGWEPRWVAALGFLDTLRPPSGERWGVRGSFDGEFIGLGSRWSAPASRVVWERLGTPEALRLLRLGGVSHVLRVGESAVPGLEPVETRPSPYACPLQVWRVPDALPGACVVRREREARDPEAVFSLLLEPGFDPRKEVLLHEARPASPEAPGDGDEARVVSRRPDTLEVEARLAAPGVLVVLEAFDPGWTAAAEGTPVPVLRANGLFRAVRLGEGRHRVRFAYRPRSALAGAVLTALGLAAAAALAFVCLRRGRRAEAGLSAASPGGSIGAGARP
jgi:hypothetical protein